MNAYHTAELAEVMDHKKGRFASRTRYPLQFACHFKSNKEGVYIVNNIKK